VRRSGKSFKETVNETLRLGFVARTEMKPAKKFVVRPFPMGPPNGLSYDNVEELLDWLEGPMRRPPVAGGGLLAAGAGWGRVG
jgi:hypothetical protein